jgi:hypothetical protein
MVWLLAGIGCLVCAASAVWAHRLQGPFLGYRQQYTQAPVVEQTVQTGPYKIVFCAFDMGHEVHLIAYALMQENGNYYLDLKRIGVHDPDGNALTVYRDDVVEVIDEPVQWAYRSVGLYEVSVDLLPERMGMPGASASFTVPLAHRSPTSIVLVSALGVLVATTVTVAVMRWRRRHVRG